MDEPSPRRSLGVTLHARQVRDRAEWDAAVSSLPQSHVLQTWDWGEFKSHWGWQPVRLLYEDDGHPLAAAQALWRKLPRLPLFVAYVPKGPLLDYEDIPLLAQVLSELERQAQQRRSLFIKIDPNVWLGHGPEDAPPLPIAQAVTALFQERGWRPSAEQIQFKNTLITDLRPGEHNLLAQMKSKTRYNIRLTGRRGVSIHRGSETDLITFYELYSETSQRDGFLIRPQAYYLDLWAQFMRAGRASLLLAEKDGEIIAGLMLFHFGPTAWYMYGASSNRYRNLMPNHRLQWEAMRLAKQLGCTEYDMWGAPDRFDESDPMWGVYRFKAGFGGKTMRGIGAYDYASSPWLYWIYTVIMPTVLTLMRRRHKKGTYGR